MITSPFIWYESKDKQVRFVNETCCFKMYVVPNANSLYSLWPFVLEVPTSFGLVTEIKLFNVNDVEISNESSSLLYQPILNNGQLIVYSGGVLSATNLSGCYYLRLKFTNNTYLYSEVFTAVPNVTEEGEIISRLEWWDDCDIASIPYDTAGFKHFININAKFYLDKIDILEEGIEDSAKNFTPTLQKFTNVYVIQEYLPTFLLRSLAQIQLHSNVRYYPDWRSSDYILLKNIKIIVDPDDNALNGTIKISFTGDQIIKTACCDPINIVTQDPNYIVGSLTGITAVPMQSGNLYTIDTTAPGTAASIARINPLPTESIANPDTIELTGVGITVTDTLIYLSRNVNGEGILTLANSYMPIGIFNNVTMKVNGSVSVPLSTTRAVSINGTINPLVSKIFIEGLLPAAIEAVISGTSFSLNQLVPIGTYNLKIYPVRIVGNMTIKGIETLKQVVVV